MDGPDWLNLKNGVEELGYGSIKLYQRFGFEGRLEESNYAIVEVLIEDDEVKVVIE